MENELSLRHQFYYARELFYHERYEEAIKYLENFIKNPNAWLENRLDAIKLLSHCYNKLNLKDKILPTLLYSLELDTPRAEICCEIGQYFINKKQYKLAIFWYELALTRPQQTESGGFILSDCYGYIPNMQLCICHYHLGEYHIANECNEKAGKLKPNDKNYKINKKIFSKFIKYMKGEKMNFNNAFGFPQRPNNNCGCHQVPNNNCNCNFCNQNRCVTGSYWPYWSYGSNRTKRF